MEELSQITPRLFLTNWTSSQNIELLKKYKIGAILTAETKFRDKQVLDEYESLGILYKQIFIQDSPVENISLYFNPTYEFIEHNILNGRNVLVNCHAGISRSSTLVLNWIIRNWYNSCPKMEPYQAVMNALDFLQEKRSIVNPNPGFIKQLTSATEVYHESCGHLKERQAISNSPSSLMNPATIRANPVVNQPMNVPRMGSNVQDVVSRSGGADPNIIFLTDQDFDTQGNLVNFSEVNGVIWFFSHGCGHCQHMKSEYEKFAKLLENSPSIRAFAVDTAKHRDLMSRVKPEVFGFAVMGVPMVVGYNKGKFYSEYADDDRTKFRTAESLIQYAAGIGNALIENAPSR